MYKSKYLANRILIIKGKNWISKKNGTIPIKDYGSSLANNLLI